MRPNQLVQPPDLLTHFLKDPGAVPSPCSVLVKRTVLNEVGGLDEAFRGLYEDQALYAKVATHAPVYVAGTHWARYRQHPASLCAVAGRLGQETAARRLLLRLVGRLPGRAGYAGPSAAARVPVAAGTAALSAHLRRRASTTPHCRSCAAVARRLAKLRRAAGQPAVGRVRFGDLRRLSPFSQRFGFERGQPIDRHYIEMFLARHQADVQGDVLEIGDDAYTRAYGGARVRRSDVLHLHADNPKATIVADLSRAEHLAAEQFDCIICTQTLQYIFDCQAAVRTLSRLLKPGGVVLATAPGLSQVGMEEWSTQRRWAFTDRSVRELFESAFPPGTRRRHDVRERADRRRVSLRVGCPHLRPSELERVSSQYQLVIAVRAMKPAG